MKFLPIILLALLSACGGGSDTPPNPLAAIRAGDILFQDLASSQGQAVKLATHSEITHCGIVLPKDGKLWVYEAVGPVRAISVEQWIHQGVDSSFQIRRLDVAEGTLTDSVLAAMRSSAEQYLGRPYDFVFGWSDASFYCSELVWKVYAAGAGIELTELRKLKDYDLTHPAVQEKLAERYGPDIPYDEPMVAPSDLAESGVVQGRWPEDVIETAGR